MGVRRQRDMGDSAFGNDGCGGRTVANWITMPLHFIFHAPDALHAPRSFRARQQPIPPAAAPYLMLYAPR